VTNVAVATATANGSTLTRSAHAVVCSGDKPPPPSGNCPFSHGY